MLNDVRSWTNQYLQISTSPEQSKQISEAEFTASAESAPIRHNSTGHNSSSLRDPFHSSSLYFLSNPQHPKMTVRRPQRL